MSMRGADSVRYSAQMPMTCVLLCNFAAKRYPPKIMSGARVLEYVYYRGDLSKDMRACDGLGKDDGAPTYKRVLTAVKMFAEKLEGKGLIVLTVRQERGYKEYVATLPPPATV